MVTNDKDKINRSDDEVRFAFSAYIEKVVRCAKSDYTQKLNRIKDFEALLGDLPDVPEQTLFELAKLDFEFEEKHISDAISKLPLLKQSILKYIFIDDMPVQEIARKLNCTADYVYL